MKHLLDEEKRSICQPGKSGAGSAEEKWNWMSTIITFLIYAVSTVLAVLALYFTNGPTNEDLVHGCQFMLALVVLVTIYVTASLSRRGF